MSQFRKKSSVANNRSPSPINNQLRDQMISGQHLSNTSQNYVPSLQKGKEKNESLMNSMMKDGIFDGPEIDLKKHTKFFSDIRERDKTKTKTDNALNFDLPPEKVPMSLVNPSIPTGLNPSPQNDYNIDDASNEDLKGNENESNPNNYSYQEKTGTPKISQAENAKINDQFQQEVNQKLSLLDQQVSKGPSFKEQILAIKDPVNQEDNFYKSNLNLVLTIITLKKITGKLHEENSDLKKKKTEFELRENEYQTRIRKLEANIDEFRLKEKLWNTKPSEYIKFDLDDLNLKLKSIDESLDKATGDALQERFLEDIVAKNKEYLQRNEENSNSLKQLKENLGQLKSTLMNMNQG